MTSRSFNLLDQAVQVQQALIAESQTPYAELLERDRALGAALKAETPEARILAWWQTQQDAPVAPSHVSPLLDMLSWLFALAGFLSGASVMGASIAYRGDYPINLLTLFALLLLIPWITYAIGLALRCVARLRLGKRPLAGFTRRLIMHSIERFADVRWQYASGQQNRISQVAGALSQRMLQGFAVCFYLASIAVGLLWIIFSDLAFGWSSTLEVQAETIHSWTTVLSLPWAIWLPDAVPSAFLIEQSQFFRIADSPYAVHVLARWWPFVVLSLFFWGLVPRMILWWIAGRTLNRAVRRYLLDHPLVTALLDRLTPASLVYTTDARPQDADVNSTVVQADRSNAESGLAISWNGAAEAASILQVYSGEGLAAHTAQLQALPHRRLEIWVKSWEPPVLEFIDLLHEARSLTPEGTVIVVIPKPLHNECAEQDLEVWQRALARLGDPRVYLQDASV